MKKKSTKTCAICKRIFPTDHFFKNKNYKCGRIPRCRKCDRAVHRTGHERIKVEVLSHYSGGSIPKCACCGESFLDFLSIDHIDGGGNVERKSLKGRGGIDYYRMLRIKGYPIGLQVLCYNCNMAKGRNKKCPHQDPKRRREIAGIVNSVFNRKFGPGLCKCGCGEATTIPSRTNSWAGQEKGVPLRFKRGHHLRLQRKYA